MPAAEPATAPLTGNLVVDPATTIATQTIGPGGGTITIARPGDALDGMVIDVPAGTYADRVSFVVGEHAIRSADFGSVMTPISPLISIDNGGVLATGDPVALTVPATVPEGANVLGFYYDSGSGSLDPLPLISQSPTSVTVAAVHFSDIFLALVDWSKIPATVDSGFRPGVDDWQFPNYGSFIAPAGHCEGQSTTEIWYYVHQRGAGASPLYSLYDNNGAPDKTPVLWQDDSNGYRLASVVQADPVAEPLAYKNFKKLGSGDQQVVYNLFRAAIATSGEPQLIGISDSAGGHGHALVVYRVTPTRMYVADPNYPGRLRTISYDAASGKLGPYSSGDSASSIAANGAVSYTQFAYIAAQASAADATIAAHWAEFESNQVGNSAFPSYQLQVWEGKNKDGTDIWTELIDGYLASDPTLRVRLVDPSGGQVTMAAFRDAGTKPLKGWGAEQKIALNDGANNLGFVQMGAVGAAWKYVNFIRLVVNKGEIDINGSWSGTITFTDIKVDEATKAEAEAQGCDPAIMELLLNQPLPMTLGIIVDKEGDGSTELLIDTTSLSEDGKDSPDPQTLDLTYAEGVVTFDLGEACEGATCAMTGSVSTLNGTDTINGTLTLAGDGYSGKAGWTVTRDQ